MKERKDDASLTNSYSGLTKIAIAGGCIAILIAVVLAGFVFAVLVHTESEIKSNTEYRK
jgi:hypothetical protein